MAETKIRYRYFLGAEQKNIEVRGYMIEYTAIGSAVTMRLGGQEVDIPPGAAGRVLIFASNDKNGCGNMKNDRVDYISGGTLQIMTEEPIE